ncbi:hypothetical protein L211DRAFT_850197 [Terfezia boudieri ATCC MYA-4762]|uniref:Uncharacterized protein n=1 Tax=Terfezia boudieri ATCC MYA-4762 TaxID=1051890 RepID=A0A3N4LXJ8_9PEZI|nr:hypothetical protein L211DRAFT_850197 [Terfezia boudieri ATCC MYA-4762]
MPARVSFYRPTGQSRRSAASQPSHHDVIEGLPIRRWAKAEVPIGLKSLAPPAPPELPLPKETHLLTPMSQALLQAARAGTLDKPKPNQTQTSQGQQLFMIRRWCLVPRHLEPGNEMNYLGKLPDVARKRRRVRKRAEGKIITSYLDEMGLGGEIAVGAAGGQALAGSVGQVAPTPRRRPPPKRKPGRGRKPGRKVKFAEEAQAESGAITGEGVMGDSGAVEEGEKKKDEFVKVVEVVKGDIEVMELDAATEEGELKPTTEIDIEMEKVEEEEEKEALKGLQA